MTEEDRASFWDDVHRRKAPEEVSWFEEVPAVSLRLLDATGVGPSGAVVDIGGGASRLDDALLARGFLDMTVLDVSAAALETARRRLGSAADGVDWIVADVTRWKPTRTYDLWDDRAAFHFFVEEADRRTYRDVLESAVRPGGHAIISTFASDGPERCSGLPVVRQDGETLAAVLGPSFEQVHTLRHEHRTPAASIQRFQFATLRRTI